MESLDLYVHTHSYVMLKYHLEVFSLTTMNRFSPEHNDKVRSLTPCASPHQSPPNFLHAASLAKHVKPVVIIPNEDDEPEQQDDEDDEPEPLIEVSDVPTSSTQPQVQQQEGELAAVGS